MAVIQSFAKNFGLYGQRVGCMSIPNEDENWVKLMNDFLGSRVRKLYSSNPRLGSDIIKTVLSDPKMRSQWDKDIFTMSQRIVEMRQSLYNEIQKLNPTQDWSYIIKQQGMFAYTHIKQDQVVKLREQSNIYMLEMGRVSICGINSKNVARVGQAFHKVTTS
jgi:aspartate/tyrosine/aromatic aminotransferase